MEDDFSLRRLYEMILSNSGFKVIATAENGDTALKMFKSFSTLPDIILMDHRMPIKNGLETMKEILEISQYPKIIFVSADVSVKQKALSSGSVSFLEKPFSIEVLLKEIKEVLSKSQAQDIHAWRGIKSCFLKGNF